MKKICYACIASALLAFGMQAQAGLITIDGASDVGNIYTINYSLDVTGGTLTGLTEFTLKEFEPEQVVFEIYAKNTSTTGLDPIRFTSFAFDASPAVTSVSLKTTGDVFDGVTLKADQGNPTNAPLSLDICVFAGSSCASGSVGLLEGQDDTLKLAIGGDFSNGLVLSDFLARFTGELGSHKVPPANGGTPVPEPGVLGLLGLGLAGLGLAARRRHKRIG
ncbi:cistern family PEP-CTERM protein [Methylonatrum kenyense]|uniref:cistern family PEP-CTERM protein n=1 Tax=Methylonatrum kenyense TaxID=455253 RepID=UPI0020BF0888|nr:cistern family PEP-CTERM protein [Methylonatrum kenyense]MCK8516821.1 cistern family PEP-CTERM protein [Methylonatrum kenyense]